MSTKATLQSLTNTPKRKFRDIWLKDYRADKGNGALLMDYHGLALAFIELRRELFEQGEHIRLNLRYFERDLFRSDVTFDGDRFYLKYSNIPLYHSTEVLVHKDDGEIVILKRCNV